MNQFELEMKKVAQERDAELLRLDSNLNGIRRDCDRRIRKMMFDYTERIHQMEKEWLDMKLRINGLSDMQARFGMMDKLHRLEEDLSYQRKRRTIDLKAERDELNVRMKEAELEKRHVRLEADRRLTEIQERYQHWLENRERTEGDEKI